MEFGKLEHAFIASSKVIRYKISPAAADILATLMYKHQYWKSEEKLSTFKGNVGFYMSINDIIEETGFKKSVISKNIKLLKAEGLLGTGRQGLNKPNYYYIHEGKILNYIKKYESEYEQWRLSIRDSNSAKPHDSKLKVENDISGSDEIDDQETIKLNTTKNKITNNKITKENTNHASVEENDWLDNSMDKLEMLIEDADRYDEVERKEGVKIISNYLLQMVPKFKGFRVSNKDLELVDNILEYRLYAFNISDKIISNAKRIMSNQMECRFGNLFVGLEEINNGMEVKYG